MEADFNRTFMLVPEYRCVWMKQCCGSKRECFPAAGHSERTRRQQPVMLYQKMDGYGMPACCDGTLETRIFLYLAWHTAFGMMPVPENGWRPIRLVPVRDRCFANCGA